MTYKNLSFTEIASEAQETGFNWFADRDLDIPKPIVSDAIPSPFCRIEMVEQAFKWVNKKFREANNDRLLQGYALGADNIMNGYHRIISEALDVGMMFCYKNMFFNKCEKVEVETDFAKKIQQLQQKYRELQERQTNNYLSREQESELKSIAGEIRFFNALNMFEREDQIFNGKMNPMVLLKWENVVVGGTSPVSLFLATEGVKARLLRECRSRYNCNNNSERDIMDKYFPKFEDYTLFHDYKPLFKRSVDFQQFVYDNAYSVAGMSSFREYINNCLSYQNSLGLPLLQEQGNPVPRPNYTEVPVLKDADNRQNTTYLKKTISSDDLFEDYIVESRYQIDSNKFKFLKYDYKDTDDKPKSCYFFLPLRKEFFQYFGKNAVDNVKVAGVVSKVNDQTKKTIECLYTQDNITYRKTYKDENSGECGYGKIKSLPEDTVFSLSFLPFIKPSENQEGRVAAYAANCRIDDVKFYSERDGEFTVNSEDGLKVNKYGGIQSTCFTVRREYDCINLTIAEQGCPFSVFIVPELSDLSKRNNGDGRHFNFSVDIGTTNTYIAYNERNGNNCTDPKPFDAFKDNENLFVNLYKYSSTQSGKNATFISFDYGKIAALEFLPPDKISLECPPKYEESIRFPLRTVLWQKRNATSNNIFSDRGLDFIHETILPHDYDEIEYKTGYKWGEEATSLLKATIDEIVILIRAFVELQGGSIETLSTFYPVSMDDRLKRDLRAHWEDCCKNKLDMPINDTGDLKGFRWVSESEAPMRYYSDVEKNDKCKDLGVAVDIGGGSTDVALYDKEGNLSAVTSFQFAGDVIFGDKLNIVKSINNKFYDDRFSELQRIKSSLSDLHSYLFSIPKDIFNYSEVLTHNKRFTLTVYYFYAAILFHVCAFLKANGHNLLPSAVVFSGNGSKILSLIDSDKFRRFTIDFMKKCLVSAEQSGNQDDVEICLKDSPKVITAEGGLYATKNSNTDIETVLFPGKNDCSKMTFVEAGKLDAKKACLDEINKFNGIFFEVGKKDFEAGQLNFLKQYAETNLNAKRNGAENETFFDFWYDKKLRETENRYRMHDRDFSSENSLQETTFFFPIRFIIDKALENVETGDAKNK